MSDITYEPTRDHWTPYAPWMRDVLADDARASVASSGTESRSTWDIYRRRTDSWAAGVDLRIHPDDAPERPTEADPDEALAVIIDDLVDVHGSTSEWADNEYITRSTALAIARAAREHIEAEREEGGYSIRRAERECKRLTDRADLWRERCQKAEADLADMTAERDKWKARYKALRGDVHLLSVRATTAPIRPKLRAILDRDDERGGQA